MRAAACDGDGGGRGGKAGCGPGVVAFEERHGKCAVKTVAGGYGIEGMDGEWFYPRGLALNGDVGAFGAALEDNAFEAFVNNRSAACSGLQVDLR